MRLTIRGTLVGLASVFTVFAVQAATLSPGTSISLVAGSGPVGATSVTSSTINFTAPTFSGTLISTVWSGDTANLLGGLTFTYQLFNNTVSPDPIDRFTLSSFAGVATDASYFGAGIVPTSVVRNPAGNQISFNFTGLFEGTLVQGGNSALLVLQTDSTHWQHSLAGVINSSSVNVDTFAPTTVPEPTTAALALLGALSLVAIRRKQ